METVRAVLRRWWASGATRVASVVAIAGTLLYVLFSDVTPENSRWALPLVASLSVVVVLFGLFDAIVRVTISSAMRDAGDRHLSATGVSPVRAEVANEVVYVFYSQLLGLAFEDLLVEGRLNGEDGSVIVKRESSIVSRSSFPIDAIDQYLITEASEGTIDVVDLECFTPFTSLTPLKSLTPHVGRATADSLILTISIDPPLSPGEALSFRVTESTPPGAITRTRAEMKAKVSGGRKVYPYESFYWDITRPTKRLRLRFVMPLALAPSSAQAAAWLGASRLRHDSECKRIKSEFSQQLMEGQYVLTLDVAYPIPGLRYAIQFMPRNGEGNGGGQ